VGWRENDKPQRNAPETKYSVGGRFITVVIMGLNVATRILSSGILLQY
jgi:hypothetical protein